MVHLEEHFCVSERRACQVTGQQRATQRYPRRVADDEAALLADLRRLSAKHPRFGTPRIWALLRRDGWDVNHKRVERLWRQTGLQVPKRQRKRRRLGVSANGCTRRRAAYRNHVWTYDFVLDRIEGGRRMKLLTVVDEYTRECLAIEVRRNLTGKEVVAVLQRLVAERGAPAHVRSDNGPEFIAGGVRRWLAAAGSNTLFIAPASPWENAYIESFNGKLQDELLKGELFTSLAEARLLIEAWRQDYNRVRPHGSLDYMTPAEFAAACGPSGSATLRLRDHTQPQRTLVELS